MQQEINAFEKNDTWTLRPLPPHKRALACKWVYGINLKVDGTIKQHKAHLVILGNHQKKGEDFTEIFALVAKLLLFTYF